MAEIMNAKFVAYISNERVSIAVRTEQDRNIKRK